MSEQNLSSEGQNEQEPTREEIINVCIELLGEEVRGDFDGLDYDEVWNHAYTILLENGFDPDEEFKNRGKIIK